jgi:uncharacterized membrane protein
MTDGATPPNPAVPVGRAWIATAAAGVALTALVCWPGYLSGDSLWQLQQARSGEYNTWHPVIMSFLWRYFDRVVPGPGGMFLFHAILFWTGLAFGVAQLVRRRWLAATVALAIGLSPPVVLSSFTLVKDSGHMGAMALACATLLHAWRSGSRASLAVSAIALFYAISVRFNGIFAVVPLVPAIGLTARRCFTRPSGRRAAIAVGAAAMIAMVAVDSLLTRFVFRAKPGNISQALFLHDIVGVALMQGRDYLPDFYTRERPISRDELAALYHPHSSYNLLWGDPRVRRPGFAWTPEENRALLRRWVRVVVNNPLAYLRKRGQMLLGVLGIGAPNYWPYWLPPSEEVARERAPKRAAFYVGVHWKDVFFFRGWFYFVLLVATAVAGRNFGLTDAAAFWSLAASALAYQLAYFFIASESYFRFSWWTMVAALVAPAFVRWDVAVERLRRIRKDTPAAN